MKKIKQVITYNLLTLGISLCLLGQLCAQNPAINIDLNINKKLVEINPDMYGIFFEDINFAADGGLYAEMIMNRSFEFPSNPLMGWAVYGEVTPMKENPVFDRNPTYLRIQNIFPRKGAGIVNQGFRSGLSIKAGESYNLVFYARTLDNAETKVNIDFIQSSLALTKEISIVINKPEWTKYSVSLTPGITDTKCKLHISLPDKGTIDIDHVSLFPKNTYKGRENGLRNDLAKALEDIHPGVMRFPGGCIVEGNSLATRYQWKNTIGPVENRPINENRWNYNVISRLTPDYWQSYGLGFYEYFLFCEDIGAAPLPVLNCGMACNFESKEKVSLDSLKPYIQDALDLAEFALGPATSKWGKVRSDMGHPAPFKLKYMAIGNEQFDFIYPKYLEPFIKAIKPLYPQINIIGSAGPGPRGNAFDFLWPEMNRVKADLVDEHFYASPDWFLKSATRYDKYDRKGAKVFAGEYACHVEDGKNSMYSALCEAAFMTGLERNADVVTLATYAPLFAHIDGWQWKPDLIWFDNARMVKSVNYYVQQLYGNYNGSYVVPLTIEGKPITGQNNLFASACISDKNSEIIVKIAFLGDMPQAVNIRIPGLLANNDFNVKHIQLSGPLNEENTLDEPNKDIPRESNLVGSKQTLAVSLLPKSFNVFVFKK